MEEQERQPGDPTEWQILAGCAAIQSRWSANERRWRTFSTRASLDVQPLDEWRLPVDSLPPDLAAELACAW